MTVSYTLRNREAIVYIPTVAPIEGAPADTNAVSVEVAYTKGGASYLTGRSNPRGYVLRVMPVTRKDGFTTMTFSIGGVKSPGGRLFLKTAARYSAKDLERLARTYLPKAEELTRLLEAGREPFEARLRELAAETEALAS